LKLRTASGNLKAQALGSSSIARYIAARRREDATPANATSNRALAYVRRATKLGAQQDPPLVLRVPHFEMLPVAEPRQGVVTHEDYRAVRDLLTRYARIALPDCPLLVQRHGKPVQDFEKVWTAACTAAKVPAALFHDLRRTALANMIEAGLSEKEAMEISGHRTRAVFDRYHIVSERRLREMAGNWSCTSTRRKPQRLKKERCTRPWCQSSVSALERSLRKCLTNLVSRAGLEPATTALKVRCSTN
jgi:hypothetical protein